MQAIPSHFESAHEWAQFRRLPERAGVELYRAQFVRHAFEPHAHAAFGLGVIHHGVERFRYRGSEHRAPQGSLALMNPDELHTGRAETGAGWRYTMLYLDPSLLAEVSGETGWWFDTPVAHDLPRAARAAALLQSMWHSDQTLDHDSLLADLVQTLRPLARTGGPLPDQARHRFQPVIDCMRARLSERITLDELGAVAGLSRFHFQRSFRAQHHATPQQMLMALRLDAAKRRLAAGEPAAAVAAAVGLADQAHLTRAFRNRYGTTPARYAQQAGTRPRLA